MSRKTKRLAAQAAQMQVAPVMATPPDGELVQVTTINGHTLLAAWSARFKCWAGSVAGIYTDAREPGALNNEFDFDLPAASVASWQPAGGA
jgi:hypothetical protein